MIYELALEGGQNWGSTVYKSQSAVTQWWIFSFKVFGIERERESVSNYKKKEYQITLISDKTKS